MLRFIATDVVVSKGYGDTPALRYSEDGSSVRFRIGKRIYDKRQQDNHRWININVKAFGELCERLKKMRLDEGSFLHFEGRFDEDVWEDENGSTMRAPVIILTDIEYAYSGNGKENNRQNENSDNTSADKPPAASRNSSRNSSAVQASPQGGQTAGGEPQMPESFTGFQGFGSPNPFFPQ